MFNINNKKGELGVGTLIILIAVIIFVAAVIFAIFDELDVFSSGGFIKAKFSQDLISKGVKVISVEGVDGRDEEFSSFYLRTQLLPDSPELRLQILNVIVKTSTSSASLQYREGTPIEGPSGYISYAKQEFDELFAHQYNYDLLLDGVANGAWTDILVDIDQDGTLDTARTCDGSGTYCPAVYDGVAIAFNLSGVGIQYAILNDTDGNLVNVSPVGAVPINVSYAPIGDGTYGFLRLIGTKGAFQAYFIGAGAPVEEFVIFRNATRYDGDLDEDGQYDYFAINSTSVELFVSSDRQTVSIPLGADISTGGQAIALSDYQIHLPTVNSTVGTLSISGTTTQAMKIDSPMTFEIAPYNEGSGYFMASHEITAPRHNVTRFIRGEVVRFYLDSPQDVGVNDEVGFTVVADGGVSFPVTIFTGHTIPYKYEVLLFPQI